MPGKFSLEVDNAEFFSLPDLPGIMDMYHFTERLPSSEEYNRLRESAGWGPLETDVVDRSLPNSIYSVCAEHRDGLVGFGRVVGGGGLCFHIQEVIVLSDYQGKGIGRNLLDLIMAYIRRNAAKRSDVSVMAGKGLEGVYERYGLLEPAEQEHGAGNDDVLERPEV